MTDAIDRHADGMPNIEFPALPRYVFHNPLLDDGLWDRTAMHQYAMRYAESVWRAAHPVAQPHQPEVAAQAAAVLDGKSLNAKAADLLRPFLKPGEKVIWRDSFRWKDDDGVLSNHYDSMELESLAADFGYDIDWDTNFKHAAIVRSVAAATGAAQPATQGEKT